MIVGGDLGSCYTALPGEVRDVGLLMTLGSDASGMGGSLWDGSELRSIGG